MEKVIDILYLPWDSLDNKIWLGRHYLAKELSKKYRLHFIERDPTITQVCFGIKHNFKWRNLYKKKKFSDNLLQFFPSPQLFGQRKSKIISKFNQFKLYVELKIYLRKNKISEFILLTSIYNSSIILRKFRKHTLYSAYFAFDDIDSYEWSCNIDIIKHDELLTASSVDDIYVVSKQLVGKFKQLGFDPIFFPHGIDLEIFNRSKISMDHIPSDLHDIKIKGKSVITFFGKFRTNAINKTLLHKIFLENCGRYSFVFLGDDYDLGIDEIVKNYKDVYYLGLKDYKNLPYYIFFSDFIFIPYDKTLYTLNNNPIKLFQIFSIGTPLLATEFNTMISYYSNYIYLFEDEKSFYEKLELIAVIDTNKSVNERVAFASLNSWKARVEIIERNMHKLLI